MVQWTGTECAVGAQTRSWREGQSGLGAKALGTLLGRALPLGEGSGTVSEMSGSSLQIVATFFCVFWGGGGRKRGGELGFGNA